EELASVFGAVDWIERMKLGRVPLEGLRRCVVVGGGNTAIDAAREVKGLGVADVVMLYRGDEPGMSGYEHEWHAAKAEGVRGEWRGAVTAFQGAGRVERLTCSRLDAAKKPVPGSAFVIEADLVLLAIGQSKLGEQFARLSGVSVERGRIVTDAEGRTGREKWYAGGDCANGGKEVVNAAAEGKAAARAIHADLMGGGERGERRAHG
ncbi:MAG TPA: FAD-dependent oxidoreductase, partial [Phycisphaerales bacterium]|nr:FAD-dependent oxidoreductase [Phycisphaerales bacterium]